VESEVDGTYGNMGEDRSTDGILTGKPEERDPLGRPSLEWDDDIKMDIREVAWDGVNGIYLGQDSDQWRGLAKTAMHIRVL
jgi:hypothetical protein